MCVFTFTFTANAFAQQERVNLNLRNVSVKTVLDEIQRQTNLSFLFNPEQTATLGKVSVAAKDETVVSVLDRLFTGTPLMYRFREDMIVISLRPKKEEDDDKVKAVTVRGTVTDTKKVPLPGVTVQVKGLVLGTVTDVDGKWRLTIPNVEDFTLLFTFVGMKSQEVKYVGQDSINVVMEEEIEALNEVNVISTGYGDIDRRRLTSAVTSIKMDDINVAGISTVDQWLEGHIPGMIFMQNSGQAGAVPKLRIRGTSTMLGSQEPLWVLDGVVLTDPVDVDPQQLNDLDFVNLLGNAISGLNPDDIEQIDVLKDAAATAIYGTQAANGVIVITTKKGKAGPPRISYSLTGTINRRPYYSDREIYLMNSQERVDVSREMFERGMEFENAVNWVGYEAAYIN